MIFPAIRAEKLLPPHPFAGEAGFFEGAQRADIAGIESGLKAVQVEAAERDGAGRADGRRG